MIEDYPKPIRVRLRNKSIGVVLRSETILYGVDGTGKKRRWRRDGIAATNGMHGPFDIIQRRDTLTRQWVPRFPAEKQR